MASKFLALALLLGSLFILPASADDWRYRDRDRDRDRYGYNNQYDPYYNGNYSRDSWKQQKEYAKQQRKLQHEREKAYRKQQREYYRQQRDASRQGYYYGYPRY